MHLRSSVVFFAVASLVGCSSGGVSLAPPPAGPQTWQLQVGGSAQSEAFQTADYYPNAITIDEGDAITWTAPAIEPHTVSIPPPGQALSPGAPQLPVGGTTFDGTAYISSGFLNAGKTYTVTFTKAGTYTVFCLIHQPEMVATIVVQPAGTQRPKSQAALTAAGAADFAVDINAAAASLLAFPYATNGTTLATGIQPGAPNGPPTQSSVVRFLHGPTLDATTTIPVGATLTWHNISQFPHTVTFPIVGQVPPPGDPARPAVGGTTFDGTALVNSGVIVPGASFALTFTKAGTYTYYCLFHDAEGMIGTVVVQ